MTGDSAADGQGYLPLGDDPWGESFADAVADATNLFSAELENVNASDWDHEADLIWADDDLGPADAGDVGAAGPDFAL